MKPLKAGQLRHPVLVRREADVSDGKGGYRTGWQTILSASAEVEGLDGREAMTERVLEGISSFRFRVRWRPGLEIRASDQVIHQGRALNIRAPAADPDGRRRQLVFIADSSSVPGSTS